MRWLLAFALCSVAFAQRVPKLYFEIRPNIQKVAGDREFDRAAQIWAESGFNPMAVSPVGAKGLGQAMDGTWKGYQKQGWVKPTDSPFDIFPAIIGNHKYMLQIEGQMRGWMGPVPKEGGWLDASFGGYNAGPGNIKKSILAVQSLGLPTTEWKRALPNITKHHSQETLTYIPRIYKLRSVLEAQR